MANRSGIIFPLVVVLGLSTGLVCSNNPDTEGILLRSILDSASVDSLFPAGRNREPMLVELREFYAARDFRAAWYKRSKPHRHFGQFVDFVSGIDLHGLRADDYWPGKLPSTGFWFWRRKKLPKPSSNSEWLHFDVRASASYIAAATHLFSGRADPALLDTPWHISPPSMDYSNHLTQAIDKGRVVQSLRELFSNDPQYGALMEALKKYREIAEAGGWPAVSMYDTTLQNGDTGAVVRRVEERLHAEGDLDRSPQGRYDSVLVGAIKSFQRRYGIEEDGVTGPSTLNLFRSSANDQVRLIVINLDRLRWASRDTIERVVVINVPQFLLRVIEHGRQKIHMKVIVGKAVDATPIFSDKIEYVVFNPDWIVPRSIVREELWPGLKSDSGGIIADNYEIYQGWDTSSTIVRADSITWQELDTNELSRLRFVQKTGPDNPLGQVKFMMPNRYNIYLHDTPSSHLFDMDELGFSHGCIRVEQPFELAEYLLLSEKQWTRSAIDSVVAGSEPDTVYLRDPVPVVIKYQTVVADERGMLHFGKDLYGLDRSQIDALAKIGFWKPRP